MKNRTESNGVAEYKMSWGTLKINVEDEHLLDGRKITGHKHSSSEDYVAVYLSGSLLSRLIMNPCEGVFVDHINHDPTDNRRCNLRLCTRLENSRNRRKSIKAKSAFKGVYFHDSTRWNGKTIRKKPWRAYTKVMNKRIWIGYYATEIDAAMAHNAYIATVFGEFASFNRFKSCPVVDATPRLV